MIKSPYKIKHWSPVRRVPKSIDGWWNVLEWDDIEADEYGVYMYNTDTKTFKPIRYANDAPLGQRQDGSLVYIDDIDTDEYENE